MLYRLFISILATVLICQFIFGYVKSRTYNENKHKYLFVDSSYNEILFLGSSRTYRHINPLIIDSILHKNTYNSGIPGARLFLLDMVLRAYLINHRPPKIIILNLDYFSFEKYRKEFMAYENYYFSLSNKVVFNFFIEKKDKMVYLLRFCPFLQFSLQTDDTRSRLIQKIIHENENKEYKGYLAYLPIDGTYDNNPKHNSCVSLDSLGNDFKAIENMVNTCKKFSIKLILIHPPIYNVSLYTEKEMLYHNQFLSLVDSISYIYNLPFLNADTLSLSYNKDLFRDLNHLNSKGADLYSNILAHQLKTLLKKDTIK